MKRLSIFITILFSATVALSQSSKDYQPNVPDYSTNKSVIDPVPTAPPPPPSPIPVDGGVGFLLAAGLGYGLREVRRRNKKE